MARPGATVDIGSRIYTENLTLNGGRLRLYSDTLSFANYTASTADIGNYIVTGSQGCVSSYFISAGESKTFPVGSELHFGNVTINSTVGGTEYCVRVFDHVKSHGYWGYHLAPNEIINLTWEVQSSDNTGDFSAVFEWDAGAQGPSFVLSDAGIFNFNGTKWVREANVDIASATGTADINTQTLTSSINYGLYAVSSQTNTPPVAVDVEYTIPEHAPNDTLVGTLDISESDIGQVIFLGFINATDTAFRIERGGLVYVNNSDLLEYSANPTFYYNVRACDNGLPILCDDFNLTINLEEVIFRDIGITNYISPNGDGINDYWIIQGASRLQYQVKIFNASGDIVYQSDNYQNNWDGTKNGVKLAPGVYYYLVSNETGSRRGTITLIR
jgi:gliding motility-associated-like protein